MTQLAVWEFLYKKILEENVASLVTVASSSESSPGRQGFKMAVSLNGETKGTIGGGILEAKVIKTVLSLFRKNNETTKLVTLFHDPKIPEDKSGLICGGSQTIIIKILDKTHLEQLKKIIDTFGNKERKALNISNNDFFVSDKINFEGKYFFSSKANNFIYREIIGRAETAYIVGGGHVAKAISQVLSELGFYITIFEERSELFTLRENNYADKIITVKYDKITDFIDEGELSYVIIVTPKHITDKIALASVINLNVKYIGMMGSRKKINTIFELLRKEGVNENLFSKVHAPIGLDIRSETPQEIAISIAAEIIKIKNSNDRTDNKKSLIT